MHELNFIILNVVVIVSKQATKIKHSVFTVVKTIQDRYVISSLEIEGACHTKPASTSASWTHRQERNTGVGQLIWGGTYKNEELL